MRVLEKGALGAAVAAAALMTAPPATAGCDDAWTYMWASCTQERMNRPEWGNDCEIDEDDDDEVRNVLFVSNVFHDSDDNSRVPNSVFFDRIENRHNVSMNGEQSICYDDFDAAAADREEMVADRRRSGWIIRSVGMPRT